MPGMRQLRRIPVGRVEVLICSQGGGKGAQKEGRGVKMVNGAGEVIYYNVVTKHGLIRYVVQAASGQAILGRDRQRRKSRTFAQEHQAEAWIKRMGYRVV